MVMTLSGLGSVLGTWCETRIHKQEIIYDKLHVDEGTPVQTYNKVPFIDYMIALHS